MKIETIRKDIKELERALKIVEKTECYLLFNKSKIIFDLCEQINILRAKADKQEEFLRGTTN